MFFISRLHTKKQNHKTQLKETLDNQPESVFLIYFFKDFTLVITLWLTNFDLQHFKKEIKPKDTFIKNPKNPGFCQPWLYMHLSIYKMSKQTGRISIKKR